MKKSIHFILLLVFVLPLCGQALADDDSWPVTLDGGFAVGSRREARFVVMAEGVGTMRDDFTLKVGGFMVNGSDGTRGWLSNAYLGLDRPQFYLAAGQKFVVFGPAGLMVSPGARGGEAVIKGRPVTLQLLGGRTEFTPPAGHVGRTAPNSEPALGQDRDKEEFFAARVEYDLFKNDKHNYIGINSLWANSENGTSIDWEGPAGKDRRFYAEASSFDGSSALLGGLRFGDVRDFFHTSRETTMDLLWRRVPDDYTPAIVGATQYYPDRNGLAVTINHEISGLSEVALYGDSRGVMLNFMRHFSFED